MLLRLLLICCMAITIARAQERNDAGYLIYLLARDTTMAGSYSLKGNHFDITVVARPNVSVTKLKGTLNQQGELQSAEGYAYKPVPGKDSQLIITYKLYLKDDSTIIEQKRGNDVSVQLFAGRGMTANGIGTAFRYVLPFWAHYAPKRVGDSITSGHLTLGVNKKLTIKRTSKNELSTFSTVMGRVILRLDDKGRLDFIDAIGSSWNVTAKTTPELNLEQLATRYALEEQNGGGMRVINQPDSVVATIKDARIKVYYSRPQARGRVIFGNIVPWDRFWRTGANAATRFVTDKPLYFDGKELPAGAYSIFTMPSQKGWTVMFNSRANVWGTEYDPSFDVLRVPMETSAAPRYTELMTINVTPLQNGGVLEVIWENTRVSVAFDVIR
jgi:hypothetical protein